MFSFSSLLAGPSSPDDSISTPIGNTYSSSANTSRASRGRGRRRRSTTPSVHGTPPASQSRFAASADTTPSATPSHSQRRSAGRRPAASPSSTYDAPPSSSEAGDDMDEATPTFVWGTNISVQDVKSAIQMFLKHFRDNQEMVNSSEMSEVYREGKYMRAINKVLEVEGEWIDVDACDVFDYDSDLYTKMVRYPLEVLAIFDIVLMDIVSVINPLFEKHVQVRIYNLKSSTSMRNLNPSG